VHDTARRKKITVSADGSGLVSQAGTLLLAEAARVTGLSRGLSGGAGAVAGAAGGARPGEDHL
jgi:hypothetical protein